MSKVIATKCPSRERDKIMTDAGKAIDSPSRLYEKVLILIRAWVYGKGRQGYWPTSLFVRLTPLSDLSTCKKKKKNNERKRKTGRERTCSGGK